MDTAVQPIPPKIIIESENVPDYIFGVEIEPFQKEMLSEGRMVSLNNMQMPDGKIIDGKIKYSPEGIEVFKKESQLVIPEKILGHKITPPEKDDLMNGKTIKINQNGKPIYIAVDKELNKLIVRTERDLGAIKEIGDYKLTEQEKTAWINKEKLQPHLFYDNKTNTYFTASIQLSEDGKGIVYHDIKKVEKSRLQEIKRLQEQLNTPTLLQAASNAVQSTEASKENVINPSKDKENIQTKEGEIKTANTEVSKENVINPSPDKENIQTKEGGIKTANTEASKDSNINSLIEEAKAEAKECGIKTEVSMDRDISPAEQEKGVEAKPRAKPVKIKNNEQGISM